MAYLNDIVIDEAMERYGISYSAAKTLKYINRFINSSKTHGKVDRLGIPYCFASKATLAQKTKKSERTVARAIAELKAAGLIQSRRTKGIAHIYLLFANDGTSGNAKNGSYNNRVLNSYNRGDISFYHDKNCSVNDNAPDDAKNAVGLVRIGAATTENVKDEQHETVRIGKGVPTPKRRNRITKREKMAAKEKYSRLLEQKLKMASPRWLCDDAETVAEFKSVNALIDLVSDAMAVPGRQIRVNGAGLSVEQYWNTVKHISPDAIEGLLSRIRAAEITTGITNIRAYTLAAVYNAVQWHELSGNVNVSINDLYRHMA